MKKLNQNFLVFGVILLSAVFFSCSDKKVKVPSAEKAVDIVLLYHGDAKRLPFTPKEMKPYVYREKDGKIEWLFDGFLFLEFHLMLDSIDYDFEVDNNKRTPARKEQWEILLDKTFEKGRGPDGLEELMENLAQRNIYPPYKRRVVIGLPTPVVNRTDWGELNGRSLDFTKIEDRIEASSWYIDKVLDVWKNKNYKHLELEGFYWTYEEVHTKDQDDVLLRAIKEKIGPEYEFSWIPYYWSPDAQNWKNYGFDIAYQQPNYFFYDRSIETLYGAINFARDNDMSLEMEFDWRLVKDTSFMKKYYAYIDAFRKDGAWDNKRITYYEGGDGWYNMAISEEPHVIAAYDTLATILAKRKAILPVIKKDVNQ